MTINEPNIPWGFGYEVGLMPPKQKLSDGDLVRGAHNILLGQQIIAAAKAARFSVKKVPILPGVAPMAMLSNAYWLDPICLGKYPEDGLKLFPEAAQLNRPDDMRTINHPLDFCGVNLHLAPTVKAGANGAPEVVTDFRISTRTVRMGIHTRRSVVGPEAVLRSLQKTDRYYRERLVERSWPGPDGKVHDPQRTVFLNAYLKSLLRASRDGVPVRGYLHWSVLDNLSEQKEKRSVSV